MKQRKPQQSELMRALRKVDWLRAMQRVSVFLRDLRGDDPRDIQDDHETELERSQKLRRISSEVVGRAVPDERTPRRNHQH